MIREQISLSRGTILLEGAEKASASRVALFLPGMSGGALSDRFKLLVDTVVASNLVCARLEAWKDADDIKTKTFNELQGVITDAITALVERGYGEIVVVGKSFGGGLLLAQRHPAIVAKILWAPAIGIDDEGTLGQLGDVPLAEVSQLLDIRLARREVAADGSAICVIHGTADDVMPLSNSQAIINGAQHGTLLVIDGADHSFKHPEHEALLMNHTQSCLGRSGD